MKKFFICLFSFLSCNKIDENGFKTFTIKEGKHRSGYRYKTTKETLIIETQGIKNDKYLNCRLDLDDGFVRHSSNSLGFLLKKVGFKKVTTLFDAYDSSMKIMNIVLKAEK